MGVIRSGAELRAQAMPQILILLVPTGPDKNRSRRWQPDCVGVWRRLGWRHSVS